MGQQSSGTIPVLSVSGSVLPEAWEAAVLAVHDHGVPVKTEYDKPGDPPSLDATVMVEVRRPMDEPRLHKNFPGGPTELEIYRQEVVDGIHDHWIDAAAGKWTYTYHQRLAAYRPVEDLKRPDAGPQFAAFDQMAWIVDKLAEAPHTRRAQAITWMPSCDPATDDPPCLQRVWARLLPEGDGYVLNMNTHWRSRDLIRAWFMNVFAFTDVQARMAAELTERLGKPVQVGRYVDISDSLHIYGSYRDEKLAAEIEKMKTTPWTERTMETSMLQFMFDETAAHLADDPDYYAKGGK
jgi:thymidylate synthase